MTGCYAVDAGKAFDPDPKEPIMKSIFKQYERVLVESLVSSFGLDFLVKDQHGGDVDTIHNVRQVGKDEQMTYKNATNQKEYENREKYDKSVKAKYDSDPSFTTKRAALDQEKESGNLIDAYTGQKMKRNAKMDVDHVISTKEIHDDPGRVLAGLSGIELANSEENLQATDSSINRSMKEKSIDEYTEWLNDKKGYRAEQIEKLRSKPESELTDKERSLLHKFEQQEAINQERMKQADTKARKAYEAKLAKAYYTSSKFAKDLALAAGNQSIRMGARQALGFVFAEMWFTVKEEFEKFEGDFDLGEFLTTLGHGIKHGFERAKEKYPELFSRFLSGAVSGALASFTTTLCNIFFTTAKNTVRIIRQSYTSIVEAGKVLFINPQNYTFGDRMRAVVKILATGASVAAGVIVSDAIAKSPVGKIPVLGDVIQAFSGTFVGGIMSCTFLYFIDRSELSQRLFHVLDGLHTIETEINYYQKQADYFERYAAELMNIDLEQFRKEATLYETIVMNLENAKTDAELNTVLKQAFHDLGIMMPWKSHQSFEEFMGDKNAHLVFE
ncbi:MAG: hypothetical protein K2N43_08525 [Lachnospiraceae bacterium]|nr:hypothetical protein [Lachnospiraceae bacterium]